MVVRFWTSKDDVWGEVRSRVASGEWRNALNLASPWEEMVEYVMAMAYEHDAVDLLEATVEVEEESASGDARDEIWRRIRMVGDAS